MKTKALTLCALLAVTATLISQGPLAPSGPPAPVMKTLTEIEPRANLQATPPPPGVSTTNADYHYVINRPGSYYLSANLDATRKSGILISANNVTLDLNGFQISGPATGADTGIKVDLQNHQACVRNGSIRDFPDGLYASSAHSCQFSGLTFSGTTQLALSAGSSASVSSCGFRNCTGFDGLNANTGSIVTACTLSDCNLSYGIEATGATVSHCTVVGESGTTAISNVHGGTTDCSVTSSDCDYCFQLWGTVTGCTAIGNTHGNGPSAAFFLSSGSQISHCTARDNKTGASTLAGDRGTGFLLVGECSIDHCTAEENYGDGIRAGDNCSILDNSCVSNGVGARSAAGIYASGVANRIEGNNLIGNTRGIELTGQRNIVVRNTARSNTNNYVIAAGNRIAQIVVPDANAADIANANNGSTDGFSNVGVWANFSF